MSERGELARLARAYPGEPTLNRRIIEELWAELDTLAASTCGKEKP